MRKVRNTYIFFEFIILRRARHVEDFDGEGIFEINEVQPADDAPPVEQLTFFLHFIFFYLVMSDKELTRLL